MKTFQKAVQQLTRTQIELVERAVYNHDSIVCRFKYVGERIPLVIGNHLIFEMDLKTWEFPDGQKVRRKYTPISPCNQTDYLDFLFKIYRVKVSKDFPNGGKISQNLEKLQLGDRLDVEGPSGKFLYKAGVVTIAGRNPLPVNKIVMIAGGSGISPMYNVISEIARDKDDKTELVLLFANKTQEDIVLRKQLQSLGLRLKIHYVLDSPPEGWTGFQGYITKGIIESISPLGEEKTLYVSCGPRPMNQIIKGIMDGTNSHYFKF